MNTQYTLHNTIERLHKEEANRKLAKLNEWATRGQQADERSKSLFQHAMKSILDWFQRMDISVEAVDGVYRFVED